MTALPYNTYSISLPQQKVLCHINMAHISNAMSPLNDIQGTWKSQCSGFRVEAQEVSGDGPDGADTNPPSPCWPTSRSHTHTQSHMHSLTLSHTHNTRIKAELTKLSLPAVAEAALSLQYER